jgi:ribulose-phosphate 3-epimerase
VSRLVGSEMCIRDRVDGGISLETIDVATSAGADTFVAGSAVFKAENPGDMVNLLRSKASKQ